MKSASRFLILLVVLMLALAALLAVEAVRATRFHQVTAERALRDYATVAAWEFLSAADAQLERAAAAALGPVAGSPAASPYDSLPAAAALSPAADSLLPCGTAGDSSRFSFALDFRTGELSTHGGVPAAPLRAGLADTLASAARTGALGAGRYGTVWRAEDQAAGGAVAIYAVKTLRYSGYAAHDAPLAAYGVVTCPAALVPLFAGVVARHPLLPNPVTGGIPNAELVTLEVSDPAGRPLFRSGPPAGRAA
jgi:hypothetical protein